MPLNSLQGRALADKSGVDMSTTVHPVVTALDGIGVPRISFLGYKFN